MTALPTEIDPTRIDVRAATSSSGTVVCVSGEVDSTTAPGLGTCLLEVIARPGDGAIEVDLREVTFLDSTGLRLMLEEQSSAQADGWDFGAIDGSSAVKRLFDVTGLRSVIHFVDPHAASNGNGNGRAWR